MAKFTILLLVRGVEMELSRVCKLCALFPRGAEGSRVEIFENFVEREPAQSVLNKLT
jgi:hypothetical protein